jgi:hypothetical protein
MGEVQSGRLSTLLIDLEGGFARGVQRPLRCSLVDIVRESTEDMQSPLASSIIHTARTCLMGIEDLTGYAFETVDKMFLKQELLDSPVFGGFCALE